MCRMSDDALALYLTPRLGNRVEGEIEAVRIHRLEYRFDLVGMKDCSLM